MGDSLKAIIPILSTEWKVEFNFHLKTFDPSTWCSIIQITKGGVNSYGDRVPSAFINQYQKYMLIQTALNKQTYNYYHYQGLNEEVALNSLVCLLFHLATRSNAVCNRTSAQGLETARPK